MAVASNKPAAQPAAPRRASAEHVAEVPEFNQEQEFRAYRDMLLIRRFEEKAGQLYGMGLIGGFCHLYIGQEAVVIGMQLAIKPGDEVITGYRDHDAASVKTALMRRSPRLSSRLPCHGAADVNATP